MAIDILLYTSVLNTMCLYNKINKKHIEITEFKEFWVQEMCDKHDETNEDIDQVEHKLTSRGKDLDAKNVMMIW